MKLNKTTILVIALAALFIQLLIITYNHFTHYIQITSFLNFLSRILIGTTFSTIFGLAMVFIDLQIISLFDKYLPFSKRIMARIPLEVLTASVAGIFMGIILTITAHTIFPYPGGLFKNSINNALIVSVINLIIISIIEAIIWFNRNQESKIIAERLAKENTQIKFQILKDQLNPHFLFNSLNVLSSLTNKNPDKAQKFVDEFSTIYRYTLEVIDKTVVELKEEIEFAKSYLFLQKIRFEDSVDYEININAKKLNLFVPPLSLQTLLENSFKHNKASVTDPLKINIYDQENFIVISNNLQLKLGDNKSTKIGLLNLNKRYNMICGIEPQFIITEKEYIAKIPLISSEN